MLQHQRKELFTYYHVYEVSSMRYNFHKAAKDINHLARRDYHKILRTLR